MNDPEGRTRLNALGARSIPVLVRGDEFAFGQSIEVIAKFVGIEGYREVKLPPEVLVDKWQKVLSAAQRYIRQYPAAQLDERLIAARDQSIRHMGYHVFRIGHAFLQTAEHGLVEWVPASMAAPPESCRSGDDVAAYGESVKADLRDWWAAQKDKSCARIVKTYTGEMPLCDLLERQTWHSAQHTRQLAAVLERSGIAPDGPLTAQDLAGLPLPQGLWE